MLDFTRDTLPTPVGDLLVVTDGDRLVAIDYADYEARMTALLTRNVGPHALMRRTMPAETAVRLRSYFTGDVAAIDGLTIAPIGTSFQARVWAALRTIPPAVTMTYGAMATRLGLSNSARAVGRANALNPIAIVVPCHRLVGAGGHLTGYAGGLARKSWLLDHERSHGGDASS